MSLAGRVPILINHTPAITAEDVSVAINQNQLVRGGGYGNYGTASGLMKYKIQIKFGIPSDQAEFEVLMDREKGAPGEPGPDITYVKGGQTYTLIDCRVTTDTTTSDQNGKAEQTLDLVCLERIRVS